MIDIYIGRYRTFIESIKSSRPLNEYFQYSERHHIIPRCIGGTDDEDNLIYLTYREHFIAHKLLAEENPESDKLFSAYWRMCNGKTKVATPEEYEYARKRFSDSQRGENNHSFGGLSEEHKRHISESLIGRVHSEEVRKMTSERMKGNKLGLGHKMSDENKSKLIEVLTGREVSIETRKRLSESMIGHSHTVEARDKMSKSKLGNSNPMYGKQHTLESREKMSEGCKGRKFRLTCKKCNSPFLGNSSSQKYCINCSTLTLDFRRAKVV